MQRWEWVGPAHTEIEGGAKGVSGSNVGPMTQHMSRSTSKHPKVVGRQRKAELSGGVAGDTSSEQVCGWTRNVRGVDSGEHPKDSLPTNY